MSNVKPITEEEYKAAVEAAKWMADNMSSLNVVYKRMARVLLALDGAWREVPEKFWGEDRDYLGAQRMQSKAAIAARHGLPVDGGGDQDKPCPTCGGRKWTWDGPYGFAERRKPCPTCQGGR